MKQFAKANILISHYFIRDDKRELGTIEALSEVANIMIDSGAFSNLGIDTGRITGDKITYDEYVGVVKNHYHDKVWGYVNLDVIGDHIASEENYKKLMDAGFDPIPVLTPSAPIKEVEGMFNRHKRVAVSGMTSQHLIQHMIGRIQQAYKYADGDVLVHTLGFSRYPLSIQIPNATMDSSTMCVGQRFGDFAFFDPRKGFKRQNKKQALKSDKYRMELLSYGLTVDDLKDDEMFKGLSLFTLQPLYAFSVYQTLLARSYGMGFFFSLPSTRWITPLAGVLKGAEDMSKGFDAKKAIAHTEYLRGLFSNNLDKFYQELVESFKVSTDWETDLIQVDNQISKLKKRFGKVLNG